jgi:DNA mismatch endonuclease (patch repair protein)
MPDIFSKLQRSRCMSRIRSSRNKSTEIKLLRILRRNRISGWRRHSTLFGRPDFVFPVKRVALFVDGCFWHGCTVHRKTPVQNADYWKAKLIRNKQRDRSVSARLRRNGWKVIRVWEHSLRDENALLARLKIAIC